MQQNRFGEQGKAIVIGAGISGLCTAIALQKIGWKVEVYERARELKGIGAGIVLAANAMKALVKLGAAERVRSFTSARQAGGDTRVERSSAGESASRRAGKTVRRR
ncbi:FAD-dependent oxidoreductase [Brevibacillus ruminantium]|uniref:FAD-dependent oxidoreductase n=1 Tax=Brevibacillus ruminantium TaxID=2950604 RepID=UPI002AC81CF9|nr:FAD-dependent oxidoreductase [Brevibacillus ruminantium]